MCRSGTSENSCDGVDGRDTFAGCDTGAALVGIYGVERLLSVSGSRDSTTACVPFMLRLLANK
jgi:hypothetical protein